MKVEIKKVDGDLLKYVDSVDVEVGDLEDYHRVRKRLRGEKCRSSSAER